MAFKFIWKLIFVFLLGWTVIIWLWLLWPQPVETKDFFFPEIHSPFLVTDDGSTFSFREGEIAATLTYPKTIHAGGSRKGELSVRSLTENLSSGSESAYHLIVESRLDLPLLKVSPANGIEQTFDERHPLRFQWQILSEDAGQYEGELWVYILIVNEEGEIDRQAMLAVPIVLESQKFLNLSERIVEWVGGLLIPVLLVIYFQYRKIE